MSRLGKAYKAFIHNDNFHHDDGDFERPLLTVLNNLGFGDRRDLKKIVRKGFNQNTHIYSIINRIAETAADIPVIIERTLPSGEVEIVTEGDFFDFVHSPNKDETYKSFTYQSIVYQLVTGNEFQWGVVGVGSMHFGERWNLAPQYIMPKDITKPLTGPQATSYIYNYSGKNFNLELEEVMHLRKFNPDPDSRNPIMGLSPLQAAFKTMVGDSENSTAKASIIKNKGAFGLVSAKGGTGRPGTPEEGKKLQEAFNRKQGGAEKYGRVTVASGAYDFVQMAMSSVDLQLLESGVWDLRDLCAVYGVSSRMFGDPNGTTFNNVKEDNKSFYINGVLPPLEADNAQFHKFFVPGWNERDNVIYKVKHDTSAIESLQEDQAKEMVKTRAKIEIIHKILTGIVDGNWDATSAKIQLMKAFKITEEEALEIISTTPVKSNEPNPNTNE